MEFKSTYGLRTNWSYTYEEFYNIPLTWRLGVCNIEALKIRIANWTPKHDRSRQAIFYFDVKSIGEAKEILLKFKEFNFKALENEFEKTFIKNNIGLKNTGETLEWLSEYIPILKDKFIKNQLK